MKIDERITRQVENVLKNSVALKKGERIYIEAFGQSTLLMMQEFIRVATKMGAVPFYFYNDENLLKQVIDNADATQMETFGKIYQNIMKSSDVYIAIRGFDDIFTLATVKPEQMDLYRKYYFNPVHREVRVPNTRWCVMRYPNKTMAASSRMSLEAFEDFYFKACLVDYKKMGKAMEPLVKLMEKTDKVKIIAPNTHLEFSIKGIPVIKSEGDVNIPDGEVYTAPVKDSINGVVQFNTDTVYDGIFFSNIKLEFEKGKIIHASSLVNDDKLQEIINSDGARYMGEFALGLNPYVTQPILDILFDEKISGSFHMAIGNSYDVADNGNKSAVHWDLVQMQNLAKGGGEIYFDGVLIRKNGLFVIDELKGLNPENLK